MSTGLFLPNLSSPNLEQLVVGSSPIQNNKKNGAHKVVYHFGWTSRLRNLLRNSPPDCFFQICLRQIWSSFVVGSSPIQKNKKNGAHKAVYHFGWTSRLRNLLRNSPPDCFSQICNHANLEQLVVVRVQFKKKKNGAHFCVLRSLAPQVGLEPTTLRLTAACSTN